MIQRKFLVMLTTVAVLTSGSVFAGDIYRYTDADGNVHYVDRPSGAATEERMAIVSRPTNPSHVQARIEARNTRDNPAAAETARAGGGAAADADDTSEQKMTRAEKKAARREREQKCQSYRSQMETLVTSRRLYREDDNGEREYLDESQTQEARDKVQELIEANCD